MKKVDLLAKAAKRIEDSKAAEDLKKCMHPNVHFQESGSKIRCIDCKRYWLAGWVPEGSKLETTMYDFAYRNPAILDHEFRHSPNEPRRQPVKKADKKIG